MATRQRKKSFVNRLIFPAFTFMFIGYFGFHAFHGSYGLIAYWSVLNEIDVLEAKLDDVEKSRRALEQRTVLLAHGSPDRETVDELARAKLNVIHPNEVVYLLNQIIDYK